MAAREDPVNVSELLDTYLQCRTLGHMWDDNPQGELHTDLWRASTGGLALRCTRCATERFDYIDSNYQVFQRYYRYPPRYTTIPGMGTRPNLRQELMNRGLLIRRYSEPRKRASAAKKA
jgi:hypothetical protein